MINPKTLSKIGVCIADKLGYNRSDVERIGGWMANSPVINHYFSRRGVAVKKGLDNEFKKRSIKMFMSSLIKSRMRIEF
jgi:hypothetical protein